MKEAIATAANTIAPEAVHHVAGSVSILHNPQTWLVVSFVTFLAIFVKFVLPIINKGLDARAATIRDQLEQASRLRAEAQELLASYQAQQEAMLKEAEAIITTAQQDAAHIRTRAAEDLKQALERRTQQAHDKITRAEAEAVAHIRGRLIDMATDTARTMITEQASTAHDQQAVDRAIATIAQQIH